MTELIEHRRSPKEILDNLSRFRWDCEEPLARVTAEDIGRVLDLFLGDTLGYVDIEIWADAIEVREDLDFETDAIRDAVHVLANPLLEGELNRARARAMKLSLS